MTHGLVSVSWIVFQYVLCIFDHILSGFTYGTTDNGLQLPLHSGVVSL